MTMFYDILDEQRKRMLPVFKQFKDRFYLAGGTGLALQIGHRDSIDFDFFTPEHIDTAAFFATLSEAFTGKKIMRTMEEKDSLGLLLEDAIRLSFLRYPYDMLNPLFNEEYLRIASIEDIACMKLSAIVSRASWKDYIDLFFVMKKIPLSRLLGQMHKKIPELDENLVLKSLVYYDDVPDEDVMFKRGASVSRNEVERFLENEVKALA